MMASKVKPIPDGYHTATPYLIVNDAAAAIEFYKKAFGATEIMRMPGPDGKVGHAEIKTGNSPIMMADESPPIGPGLRRFISRNSTTIMIGVFPKVAPLSPRSIGRPPRWLLS